MRAKAAQRRKESKTPTLTGLANPHLIITHSLRTYSHENLAWLRAIDKILQKPRTLVSQVHYWQAGEWLERYFRAGDGQRELLELAQYYKYYKCSPLLAGRHFEFMNSYWSRSKTIYYIKIKRILQIDQDQPQQTLQKNISNQELSKTDDNKSTFYLMPQLQPHPALANDNTLEKILSSLQRKGSELRGRTIKDIDKAYKFTDQSKTKDRPSQQKSHLKTNPSNLVSQFSYKPAKKKKQNHKSLSNEPHSQERVASRGKKLATTNSCMNIAAHDSNLNYLRRDKNQKNSQKDLKVKKRQTSQICMNEPKPLRAHNDSKSKPVYEAKVNHVWNESKATHKKAISNQKSSQGVHKSKSSKKRLETHSNVKAAIDKTKNKIKMQKSIMLKKYVESRQSYTKSIDSTCGEVLKQPRK